MHTTHAILKAKVFDILGWHISNFEMAHESKEYAACRFAVNGKNICSRNAKKTPKKAGQFVTFWKRLNNGPIEPFHQTDAFDYFVVNVQTPEKVGQFVIPKAVLLEKEILSLPLKEGKRAFRVYPPWDKPTSLQALKTQKWQLPYFFEINEQLDVSHVAGLYQNQHS